jgi:hypothetical protein
MKEVFKEIPGYLGRYKCSKQGTVISFCDRIPRVLKHICLKNGYTVVNLHLTAKKSYLQSIAKIILLTWGPEPPSPDHIKVQFIDGDRKNLNLKNLRWTTKAEIMKRNIEKIKHRKFTRRKKREIIIIIEGVTLACDILHTNVVPRINTGKKFNDNILIFNEEGIKKYLDRGLEH